MINQSMFYRVELNHFYQNIKGQLYSSTSDSTKGMYKLCYMVYNKFTWIESLTTLKISLPNKELIFSVLEISIQRNQSNATLQHVIQLDDMELCWISNSNCSRNTNPMQLYRFMHMVYFVYCGGLLVFPALN